MCRGLHCQITRFTSFLAAVVVALAAIFAATTAHATSYVVNTVMDAVFTDGTSCSLRDAINAANGSPDTMSGCPTAGSGSDTITFSVSGIMTLGSNLPDISDTNLTITGPATAPGITIDGAGSLVMQIESGATVYLEDLTITNANFGEGGAIYNLGTLTVLNSTFDNNSGSEGGAIGNFSGTVTVLNSTFYGNSTPGAQGGAICSFGGTLTVVNSTFYNNSADDGIGGAIYDGGSTLTVVNSTFYDNTSNDDGYGGAILASSGSVTVQNTILVGNTATYGNNCRGGIADGGYNVSDDTSCGFSNHFIQVASASDVLNTTAGLTNNGGPTETIADLGPAVDAIPFDLCNYPSLNVNPCANPLVQSGSATSGPLTCDQRGKPRPDPGDNPATCDVGAFELQDTIAFARFNVGAAINLPDDFQVAGSFQLGSTSSGIDPVTQAVTLTLGQSTLTIPAGSFRQFLNSFLFGGKVGAVRVDAVIIPSGKNTYLFDIDGDGLTLTGISNPVTVGLQIGSNAGTASIKALIR